MARWSFRQAQALRAWREAERLLAESGDGEPDLEANVARLRNEYQRLYSEGMAESMARLREADERRARAVPSTPEFHAAARDTEEIAAEIWDQARHGDRDGPQGHEARANRPESGSSQPAPGEDVPERHAGDREREWRDAQRIEDATEPGTPDRRRAAKATRRGRWAFEDAARLAGEDGGGRPESRSDASRRIMDRAGTLLREGEAFSQPKRPPPETAEERGGRERDEAEIARELE